MVNYDGTETPTNSLGGGDNKRGLVSVETITPKTIMKLPLPSSRSSKRPFDAERNKIQHFTTKSTLTIKNATPKDAGNYTCKPSNALEASIQVFVSEGNKIRQYYLTTFNRSIIYIINFPGISLHLLYLNRSSIRASLTAGCKRSLFVYNSSSRN